MNGGFAGYVVAPAGFVYPIPESFSDIEAAPLLCAGIIGYRALRLSEIKQGGRLALYGFGASAHVCIQIARHWGCEVLVFTRSAEHQALARKLGAAWAGAAAQESPECSHSLVERPEIPPDPPFAKRGNSKSPLAEGGKQPSGERRRAVEPDSAAPARETARTQADSAIIFAPAGELVPIALGNLEKGGTLALAGIHMSPIPQLDYDELLYHERTIRSVANSTRQDGLDLLRLATEIPIRTETTVFPLEDANRALQLLKAGRITGASVLQMR